MTDWEKLSTEELFEAFREHHEEAERQSQICDEITQELEKRLKELEGSKKRFMGL